MSDDQGEQLEQGELLSLAEVLTEHASATVRAAFNRWWEEHGREHAGEYTLQGRSLLGYKAGWRAALEWYIGLGPWRAGELLGDPRPTERAVPAGHEVGCSSPPECGRFDWQRLGLTYHELGYWCHARKGHTGEHVLGH